MQHTRLCRSSPQGSSPARWVLLAFAVVGAGCAQPPVRVSGAWQPDAERGVTYSKILVVGVSPDRNARCQFEAFMANQLRSEATAAVTSCKAIPENVPLSREAVDQAVDQVQADAVLATFLVAISVKPVEGGTSETRGDAYYKATDIQFYDHYYYDYWYGAYGMPATVYEVEFRTAPSVTSLEGEVEIVSRLYDTRDASLVYEVQTRAQDLVESQAAGLAEVTGPIAERLRTARAIR